MKKTTLASLVLAAAAMPHLSVAETVTANFNVNTAAKYKPFYGRAIPLEKATNEEIDKVVGQGLNYIAFLQSFVDPKSTGEPSGSKQYFYRDNGVIKQWTGSTNTQEGPVIQARKHAFSKGLQVVHQISGTPYRGFEKSTETNELDFYPLRPKRYWSQTGLPKKDQNASNFYPVPAKDNPRAKFAAGMANWIDLVESQDGAKKSIWVGTQEPTHTLGYPLKGGLADESDANKLENIADFVDTWKQVINNERLKDFQFGGIQQNISSADKLKDGINELEKQKCPYNYFTLQVYEGQPQKLKDALIVATTETTKKLLINRYSPNTKEGNADKVAWWEKAYEMNDFINCARVFAEFSNSIHAICIEAPPAWDEKNVRDLIGFVNRMETAGKGVSFEENAQLNAIVSASSDRISALVWHKGGGGTSQQAVKLTIKNLPNNYNKLTVEIITGDNIVIQNNASWRYNSNSKEGVIEGFELGVGHIALISINKS